MALKTVANALGLLLRGDWREFNVRARIVLGQIDLRTVTTDQLNLSAERAHSYSDSRGEHLQRVLDSLRITPADAVIDYGSGKGGVLVTLARYPFSRITGIELSPELARIAERNLRILGIDRAQTVVCDAAEFRDLDCYTYVYFFNPFPAAVMRAVMENLGESLRRRPRTVTIVYLNPVCHEEVVADGTFLLVQDVPHPEHRYFVYRNAR